MGQNPTSVSMPEKHRDPGARSWWELRVRLGLTVRGGADIEVWTAPPIDKTWNFFCVPGSLQLFAPAPTTTEAVKQIIPKDASTNVSPADERVEDIHAIFVLLTFRF